MGERGGTQGRRLTHTNKSPQDLVLAKETAIPEEGIAGAERKINLEKCSISHSDIQES